MKKKYLILPPAVLFATALIIPLNVYRQGLFPRFDKTRLFSSEFYIIDFFEVLGSKENEKFQIDFAIIAFSALLFSALCILSVIRNKSRHALLFSCLGFCGLVIPGADLMRRLGLEYSLNFGNGSMTFWFWLCLALFILCIVLSAADIKLSNQKNDDRRLV